MKLNVLFIGGARRVTLAQYIQKCATSVGMDVSFISIERDNAFYPISSLATIVAGPSFLDPYFSTFLQEQVYSLENPLPVACMDAALPALAALSGLKIGKTTIIAPTIQGALIAIDKGKTGLFCIQHGIAHPKIHSSSETIIDKVLAKPRCGFGGKGIYIFERGEKLLDVLFNTHIIQDFLIGPETTHDLYIEKTGCITAVSRDRLAIVDGEVDHCIVRHPYEDESLIFEKISSSGLFWGPLTVQTIRHNDLVYLIEINARLGGGVTAGIASGSPILERMLKESTGKSIPEKLFTPLEMKRARCDFYRFIS
jgi:carbamoyl-phosphate synthase large subunit